MVLDDVDVCVVVSNVHIIMHTDVMYVFFVGEQSHVLLCQPGVIDWTKMYKFYGVCT